MKTKLTIRPVERVIAAIRTLDLEAIKLRVMDPELGEGWTREYAESIERAYRNYLTMLVKHPEDAEDIVVSKDVDEFWHTHILHTMKYTEDCEKVFGTYLHHNPEVGERTQAVLDKKAVLAEKTRRLYQQEFRVRGEAVNSGIATESRKVAFCSTVVKPGDAAFCSAAVENADAVFCSAVIEAGKPAFCSAAVKAGGAAFCSAAVESANAAFCSAALETGKAAFCSAAVKAGDAAFCSAAVERANAAFCSAAIEAEKPAFCSAAVKAGEAAFCSASVTD